MVQKSPGVSPMGTEVPFRSQPPLHQNVSANFGSTFIREPLKIRASGTRRVFFRHISQDFLPLDQPQLQNLVSSDEKILRRLLGAEYVEVPINFFVSSLAPPFFQERWPYSRTSVLPYLRTPVLRPPVLLTITLPSKPLRGRWLPRERSGLRGPCGRRRPGRNRWDGGDRIFG